MFLIQDGNSDHVEDFSQFIRTSGHIVVQCPQLDIVQLALQQPKNSQVYRTALECAKMDKFGFHVEWW
jgi:APAF-1 helical domain